MIGDLHHAEEKPPDNVLFVCKLNPVTTEDDLTVIFSRFGAIKGLLFIIVYKLYVRNIFLSIDLWSALIDYLIIRILISIFENLAEFSFKQKLFDGISGYFADIRELHWILCQNYVNLCFVECEIIRDRKTGDSLIVCDCAKTFV